MCAIFALALCLTVGCEKKKVYKIGVSQCSQDDWRAKMNAEIDREIMLHDDAEVEIRSADDDNAKQIADLRYFADNDFDIIIVSPNEAAALTPVIKEIHDKGIPVIVFDRNIIGDSYTARIGADDEGLGRSAAHYGLHLLGEGAQGLEIYGRRGSTPADDRHKGFVSEFEKGGGYLVATVNGNWNKEDAMPAVDSLLKTHPEISLIFAHNDRMAIGAAEVAKRLGRDDIRVIGIDAAPDIGIRAVADSVLDATFLYPTEGHRVIRTALAILKGEPYEREQIMPVSSAVDLTNADILLLQDRAMKEETDKLKILKARMDSYWEQHSSQTTLFYASIVIIILLFGVVFLVLRAFWQHKRHQAALLEQNKMLQSERDKQKELNDKLQEATRSKLMFFTNVSHDLRTPLTLISEPVARLSEAPNLTPEQHTLMKIADKNVRILLRLINQILDFRKYENDKMQLHLSEIDLYAALREWIDSFYALARKRDIKLRLDIPPAGETLMLAIDVEKIERVFFNLVSNAFKYTPANGEITVSCRVGDTSVTLSVADTGQGISERDLGNIFDRFFQVDRVHPSGSGIGLSLCKAFVELHGGTISVESTLKKGSVFTVTLPVRHIDRPAVSVKSITADEVQAELDEVENPVEFDSDKPLVLVIDDNADIRMMLTTLLSDKYNVLTAPGGAEGLKKASKYVPDLVICDVMMPGMDGLECCRLLKEEVATSHIPVLMLTACSLDEQRVQGYESGADGYLAKPFSGGVLQARCASLIDNRRRIKELWGGPGAAPAPAVAPAASPASAAETVKGPVDIDNDFYRRFLEILEAEMGNAELSVDGIASRMGFERSQFYRKIKALTNYSPVELIRTLRLRRARQLLTATDKSVSEIAYETGFSSPSYFSKCYREAYGQTPSEQRAKVK